MCETKRTGQYGVRLGILDVITPIQSPGPANIISQNVCVLMPDPFPCLRPGPRTGHLPLDVPSLAEGMRDAGYATGLVGKWHVGFADYAALPVNRGWDKAYNYYGGAMNCAPRSLSPSLRA